MHGLASAAVLKQEKQNPSPKDFFVRFWQVRHVMTPVQLS